MHCTFALIHCTASAANLNKSEPVQSVGSMLVCNQHEQRLCTLFSMINSWQLIGHLEVEAGSLGSKCFQPGALKLKDPPSSHDVATNLFKDQILVFNILFHNLKWYKIGIRVITSKILSPWSLTIVEKGSHLSVTHKHGFTVSIRVLTEKKNFTSEAWRSSNKDPLISDPSTWFCRGHCSYHVIYRSLEPTTSTEYIKNYTYLCSRWERDYDWLASFLAFLRRIRCCFAITKVKGREKEGQGKKKEGVATIQNTWKDVQKEEQFTDEYYYWWW